jgi:hypothetical protein
MDKATAIRKLHELRDALEERVAWQVTDIEVIDKARVPIIKFVDARTGLPVDITFESDSGLRSSALGRKAARQFSPFKYLVLLLKRWLQERSLHDTFSGGVGSFLLQLLVISSLQHPPRPTRTKGAAGNLGALLIHFFEVFGLRLNYPAVGLSVADGGTFFRKAARGWHSEERSWLLSVENPLERSNEPWPAGDVGANAYNIRAVRRALGHSYVSILDACAAAREPQAGARPRLRVLSAVLDVEEEMARRFKLHAQEAVEAGGGPSYLHGVAAAREQPPQQQPPPQQEQQERKRQRHEEDGAPGGKPSPKKKKRAHPEQAAAYAGPTLSSMAKQRRPGPESLARAPGGGGGRVVQIVP